jgi:hypothetical protein
VIVSFLIVALLKHLKENQSQFKQREKSKETNEIYER